MTIQITTLNDKELAAANQLSRFLQLLGELSDTNINMITLRLTQLKVLRAERNMNLKANEPNVFRKVLMKLRDNLNMKG